ncbi:MAG: hypothetical protein ACK5MN_10905 [Lachnospiraceae bacterium]
MKSFVKRILPMFLVAVLCVGMLAGCRSGTEASETQNTGMGRFVESEVPLPEHTQRLLAAQQLAEGALGVVAAANAGTNTFWKTYNNGIDWTRVFDLDEGETAIRSAAISSTGEVYGISKWSQLENTQTTYWKFDAVGNRTQLQVGLPNSESRVLEEMKVSSDGQLFAADNRGIIYHIRPEDGSIVMTYETGEQYMDSFFILDGTLLIPGWLNVFQYDIATGEQTEPNQALLKFWEQNRIARTSSSLDFSSKVAFATGDTALRYFCDDSGVYTYSDTGSRIEQIADTDLTSLKSPDIIDFQEMIVSSEEEFWILCSELNRSHLYQYVYSKEIPTRPSTEIKVYSLYEHAELRQAIASFRKNNPNQYVSLEIGMAAEGITVRDALKTLKTNMQEAAGPDILILDDMPLEAAMAQGVLADLTDLVNEVEGQDGLQESVKGAYAKEGQILAIPTGVKLPFIEGESSAVAQVTDFTALAAVIEKLRSETSQNEILQYPTYYNGAGEDLLQLFYSYCVNAWMREDRTLDSEGLAVFYETIQQIGAIENPQRKNTEGAGEPLWQAGYLDNRGLDDCVMDYVLEDTVLSVGPVGGIESYAILLAVNKEREDLSLRLLQGQGEAVYLPSMIAGINAQSKNKEQAAEFVAHLLSKNVQMDNSNSVFPVNLEALEQMLGKKGGSELGLSRSTTDEHGVEKSISITVQPLEKTESEELKKILRSVKEASYQDKILEEIILTQGNKVLEGSQSVDEAVKTAVQEADAYLDESGKRD